MDVEHAPSTTPSVMPAQESAQEERLGREEILDVEATLAVGRQRLVSEDIFKEIDDVAAVVPDKNGAVGETKASEASEGARLQHGCGLEVD